MVLSDDHIPSSFKNYKIQQFMIISAHLVSSNIELIFV